MLVQAGSSTTGRRFAARHAEAVFTAHLEKATAQAFYKDLKALVVEEGRSPDQALILPGLSPVIAGTEEEELLEACVADLSDEYRELIILREYAGASWEEIARETGRPSADAARMMHGKAMLELSKLLKERGIQESD